MSASLLDALAPAGGLLTTEECFMLLESDDVLEHDLVKSLPNTGLKLDTLFQDDTPESLYPSSPSDTKPSPYDLTGDLQQLLDGQLKQENILSYWLEEKVELPVFENTPQVPVRVEVPPVTTVPYCVPQPTDELLREFETVYDAVELTHISPPQTPPRPATQLLQSYAQQHCPQQDVWPLVPPATAPSPLQSLQPLHELHSVEHLLVSPPPSTSSNSPRSSPPSSPRSSSTDEDYYSSSSRRKPYSRSVDDRRSRKKEQNKNAATRYRQKKKAEVEVLLNEESGLRQRHNELDTKCSDLQREIRYLKGLMRDLFKAKGLIK